MSGRRAPIAEFAREGAAASARARRLRAVRVRVIAAGIVDRLVQRGVPVHRWATLVRDDLALIGIVRCRRQVARDLASLQAHVQFKLT